MLDIVIFFLVLFLIGLASYFISTKVYRRMVSNKNSWAWVMRVLTFVASFLVIFIVVVYLYLSNVRLER